MKDLRVLNGVPTRIKFLEPGISLRFSLIMTGKTADQSHNLNRPYVHHIVHPPPMGLPLRSDT